MNPFFTSPNAITSIDNNGLYNQIGKDNVPILIGHGDSEISMWFLDEFSDNLASTEPRHIFYHSVRAGKQNIPASPTGQFYGYKGWEFIRACNIGLENYYKASLPEAIIHKYAAEARLFRGLFYADKVSKFGDVPWIERELNVDSEELYQERMSRENAMKNILADLSFACAHLPADWGDGNAPGRLNRWAALLLKSRVCLFEGTWRKYHRLPNPEKWLQEAVAAAHELITEGPYFIYKGETPQNSYTKLPF